MILPVISIRHPWAALIVNGVKNIENRRWRLPEKYRNCTVLVHATANPRFSLSAAHAELTQRGYSVPEDVFRFTTQAGAIVGAVRFSGDLWSYNNPAPSPWADEAKKFTEDYGELHWWMIDKAQALPPIPAQGKQRFWQFDYPCPITWEEVEDGPRS